MALLCMREAVLRIRRPWRNGLPALSPFPPIRSLQSAASFAFASPRLLFYSSLSVAALRSLAGVSLDHFRGAADGTAETSRAERERHGEHIDVEAARLFSAAASRVLHLHDEPRPFAGMCLAFADAAAACTGSAGEGRDGKPCISAADSACRGDF